MLFLLEFVILGLSIFFPIGVERETAMLKVCSMCSPHTHFYLFKKNENEKLLSCMLKSSGIGGSGENVQTQEFIQKPLLIVCSMLPSDFQSWWSSVLKWILSKQVLTTLTRISILQIIVYKFLRTWASWYGCHRNCNNMSLKLIFYAV